MKKHLIFFCLMLTSLSVVSYDVDSDLEDERVTHYVQRVNQHLSQHAQEFAQLKSNAPFVMDWSEDLYLKPYLKEETIQALNKQLSFLARHTDYRFFVLVTPALPYYADDLETFMAEIEEQEQAFNQAVYEQSELSQVDGKKVVLLSMHRFEVLLDKQVDWQPEVLSSGTVSISASGSLGEVLKPKLLSYSQGWLKQYDFQKKNQHFLLRSRDFNSDGYLKSLTEYIYKELPKPIIQRSYYLTYNGEIIELGLQKSTQNVTGQKEIYLLEVISDSRLEAYANLLKKQKDFKDILDRNNRQGIHHIVEQFNRVNEELLVFDERVQEFKPIIHGLKEEAVVSETICKQFVEWYRDDHFKEVDGTRNDYTRSPDDVHFVLGKNQVIYDRNLQGFDALSALLTPVGLDVIGDGLGLLYAGYYGDAYNSAFYIAAVTIPLANKTVLKAVIEGLQHVKKVGSNFQLVMKSDALYSGLPFRFQQLLPSKILSKLDASEAKALLDKIKQAKFSDEVLTKLGKDLEADDLFELFRRDVNTVDAWGIVKNKGFDDLARSTDDLEIVSDYIKRSGKSADDVAKEIPSSISDAKKWLGDRKIEPFLDGSPNISSASAPDGYQIYEVNGSKYIRRLDMDNPYTPRLMVDENGVIVKYTKPARMSVSPKFSKNLEDIYGALPTNHQRHHLVPDKVVRNSPLHQEAVKRGLYDLDRGGNGRYLAETAEDYVHDASNLSKNYPTHLGSHPNYDDAINSAIDDVFINNGINKNAISELDDATIKNLVDEIEDSALDILEDWQPSRLN